MTRNVFADGQPFSTAVLNSMLNSHNGEAVLGGLTMTPGSGSFEVDVSFGEILIGDERVDVSSETVYHGNVSPNDRIDLITADSSGDLSVTTGSSADDPGQPNAPEIPSDEVLVGAVYIRSDASEILDGDLYDYKTVRSEVIPELVQPQGADSGLDADLLHGEFPIPNDAIANSSIDVDPGTSLVGDDSVDLGSTLSLDALVPMFGDANEGDVYYSSDATFTSAETIYGETVGVTSDSLVEMADDTAGDPGPLIIHATERFYIDPGSELSVSGAGASGGATDGGGVDGDLGGAGGDTTDYTGGSADENEDHYRSPMSGFYRDIYAGDLVGGGGGASDGSNPRTNFGGGIVVIAAPEIRIDGTLTAEGVGVDGSGDGYGGGGGGTVILIGGEIDGIGNVSVAGGDGFGSGNDGEDGHLITIGPFSDS